MVERAFRITSWPKWSVANPYQRLFYEALAPGAIHTSFDCVVDDDWLRSKADEIDAVHFHWPESLWRSRGQSWFGSLRGVVGFERYLRLAKQLGIKRIWTMHNLEHHEGASWIDRRGYRTLAKQSDLIICHSRSAADALRRNHSPRGEVVVMPHGNYAGEYPEPRERSVVLREFGLRDDLPVFVSVGQIRQYKGLDLVANIAENFEGVAQFLVAGHANTSYDMTTLDSTAGRVCNFHLANRRLSVQEFSDVVSVSEAVILPYQKITGSGALLAAWTFNRPVIATDLPYFREVAEPMPQAARFFPLGDPEGFNDAIKRHLETDAAQTRLAAKQISEHYSWEHCVAPVVDVLEHWKARQINPSKTKVARVP